MVHLSSFGFGIEIEAVVQPRKIRDHWHDKPHEYWERLALALRNRGLKAVANISGAQNHDIQEWFITRDGSLQGTGSQVCLEAISPVLYTGSEVWKKELFRFWEAMLVVFHVTTNTAAGSHIHVAPPLRDWTLSELRTIAFAIITQEHLIKALLPIARQDNQYCQPNSAVSLKLQGFFAKGKNAAAFDRVRSYVDTLRSKTDVLKLMQGLSSKHRYVLWNFKNIDEGSGTLEFRGGRHLRGPKRTLWWIAFAVSFISLALRENVIANTGPVLYVVPSTVPGGAFERKMSRFWEAMKSEADRIKMCGLLPSNWKTMRETG